MVWSACVIASADDDEGAAIAANAKKFVLQRVRLPCPYRVQMLISPGMLRYRQRVRPRLSSDVSKSPGSCVPDTSLPPITRSTREVSRSTTLVRSTTAASDVAFVERVMNSNKTRLLLAIKELQNQQMERLTSEQIARQQQSIRAGERKSTEKMLDFRVKAGRHSQWEKDAEELENDEALYFDQMNWDNGGEEVADEAGSTLIRQRLRQVDQKAQSKRVFWSDGMNRWISIKQRVETSAFWTFIRRKRVTKLVPDPSRYHDCNCVGHSSYHEPGDHVHDHVHDESGHCKICAERMGYHMDYMQKMRERLKLLREGKLSKEEFRRAQMEEAQRMRQYLAQLGEAERLRKLAEAKARRAADSSQRLKRHENTKITPQEAGDDEDEFVGWNEETDDELADLARDEGDDELNNRPELEFQDKMYESVDEEPPAEPSPPKSEPSFIFKSPTKSPSPPLEEPPKTPTPPPPPPPKEKKAAKVTFRLPKKTKKGGKKKKGKQIKPPPPVGPPTPVVEEIPPEPEPEQEPEPEEEEDFIFSTPPPMPSSFGQRQVTIEEAEEENNRRTRSKLPTTAEDDFDFFVAEDQGPTPEVPDEPAKTRLQRPANWGAPSTLADELSFRPSKSATKRRALDRAIAERQKAARGRKPKAAADLEEIPQEEEGEQIDLDWLDQFYYIQENAIISRCRYAFQANDFHKKGKLDLETTRQTLCRVNPQLSDSEIFYIERIFELFGVEIYQSCIDLRLFTIMAAFSLRLTALDDWVRSMVNDIDFRLLEYKLDFCKKLWLTCSDDKKFMSEDQFRILLLAGGVTSEHERSACIKLFAPRPEPHRLDFLDFLSYVPLFIAIHISIAFNPMDDSRTK